MDNDVPSEISFSSPYGEPRFDPARVKIDVNSITLDDVENRSTVFLGESLPPNNQRSSAWLEHAKNRISSILDEMKDGEKKENCHPIGVTFIPTEADGINRYLTLDRSTPPVSRVAGSTIVGCTHSVGAYKKAPKPNVTLLEEGIILNPTPGPLRCTWVTNLAGCSLWLIWPSTDGNIRKWWAERENGRDIWEICWGMDDMEVLILDAGHSFSLGPCYFSATFSLLTGVEIAFQYLSERSFKRSMTLLDWMQQRTDKRRATRQKTSVDEDNTEMIQWIENTFKPKLKTWREWMNNTNGDDYKGHYDDGDDGEDLKH